MRVFYNGPLDAVEVPALDGAIVERGKSIDVDPKLAEELASQADWFIRGAAKNSNTDEEVSD